ncbi:hypothetical protein DFA_02679 [Cavenderia fasciculata]|uniref:Uncharacterized protein n=1 Tax=Cavenderia fasciculata TaxID=261658 RepID=F4Q025_CACFS|nr:uncharacterized protein DFA_02679 [Cavenderia fasciculata]EGG18939.1 hypothetical protein DFA_02679 [Cavenderia fasciculata]|eukprot:XP_004357401.1 hypothetical protein DFA_02679 [Cavenderia fasciculata]
MSLTEEEFHTIFPGYPSRGHDIDDILSQIDNGTLVSPDPNAIAFPVRSPTNVPRVPPPKPTPPKTMKENKFYATYFEKSNEVFNDEKRPVPPLPAKATGVVKPVPAPITKGPAASKVAAAEGQDFTPKSPAVSKAAVAPPLLPPPDASFVMPPFDPDRVVSDEEGLKIILHFSVFEGSKNVVADNANNYFLENVLYYTDPNSKVLDLFGIKRPVLDKSRLDISDDPKVTVWYSFYSFFYLPLIVANGGYSIHQLETGPAYDNTYAHQRMLLFKYAFCQKNQWMQKFQKNAVRWLPLYMAALKDQFNLAKHTQTTKERTTEQLQAFIVNAKATLDVLDPTGENSKNMINILMGSSIFVGLDQKNSIKDTPQNRQVIKDTVKSIVEYVKNAGPADPDDPDSVDKVVIGKDLIAFLGGTAGAISAIQKAILATQFESVDGPDFSKGFDQYFKDIGARVMNKMQFSVAEKKDKFFKWLGRAFKTCQVGVIIYSIYNWDKLDTYNKLYFMADIVNIGLDLASATKTAPKALKQFGNLVGLGLNKIPYGNKVLSVLETAFTTDLAEFVQTRFSPILMAVSAIKSVYDCVQDAQEGNIGAMVIDGASAVIGLGAAVAIFAGCACAGPLALLAGGVLLALAGLLKVYQSRSLKEREGERKIIIFNSS